MSSVMNSFGTAAASCNMKDNCASRSQAKQGPDTIVALTVGGTTDFGGVDLHVLWFFSAII